MTEIFEHRSQNTEIYHADKFLAHLPGVCQIRATVSAHPILSQLAHPKKFSLIRNSKITGLCRDRRKAIGHTVLRSRDISHASSQVNSHRTPSNIKRSSNLRFALPFSKEPLNLLTMFRMRQRPPKVDAFHSRLGNTGERQHRKEHSPLLHSN